MSNIDLTDEELALLDGKCRPEVQAKVSAALERLASSAANPGLSAVQAGLLADIVSEAVASKYLVMRSQGATYCARCKKVGEMFVPKGKRKKRQRHFPVYDFAWRFISIRGYVNVGGCDDCVNPILPLLRERLRTVDAEVPLSLLVPGEPIRTRWEHKRCLKCGWEGHEGEMGDMPNLFHNGKYKGICPKCGVRKEVFQSGVFETREGFTVVRGAPYTPEPEAPRP